MTDTPETEIPKSKIKNQKSEIGIELPLPLTAMVEALLFVSSEPVPVQQIAEALDFKVDAIEQALIELRDGIEGVSRGLRLQRKGDKVQLTTHPECAPYIERFLGLDLTSRLSKPALGNVVDHRVSTARDARADRTGARRELRWRVGESAE